MKVHQLTDSEKSILGALLEEQKKLSSAQADLNSRTVAAMTAFCQATGMKEPLVLSEDGNFVVEATRQGPRGV